MCSKVTLITEDMLAGVYHRIKTCRKCRNRSLNAYKKAKKYAALHSVCFYFVLCRHGFRISRPENGRNLPGGKYILQALCPPHDLSVSGRPETHLEKHRPAPQRYYQRYDSGFFHRYYYLHGLISGGIHPTSYPWQISQAWFLPHQFFPDQPDSHQTYRLSAPYLHCRKYHKCTGGGRPFQRAFLQAGPPRPFRKIRQPAPGAAF